MASWRSWDLPGDSDAGQGRHSGPREGGSRGCKFHGKLMVMQIWYIEIIDLNRSDRCRMTWERAKIC